jgi:dihydroneopterin triphosphate diphosphatase
VARAPFQILVLPYRALDDGDYEFAIFSRRDCDCWQGIAGGGEDDETPLEAAKREALEEAGISTESAFLPLDTLTSVPVTCFGGSERWGEQVYVITEHSFGVDVTAAQIALSGEHTEFRWLPFAEAEPMLLYDSNRVALWELNQKIRGLGPRDPWK